MIDTENKRAEGLLSDALVDQTTREAILALPHPALLLASDGRTPLWSSHSAARQLGFRDASALMRSRLPDSAPGTRRLAEIGTILQPDMAPRLERLRYFVGFRGVILTALCRAIALRNGQIGLFVALIAPHGLRQDEFSAALESDEPLSPSRLLEVPAAELPAVTERSTPLPERPHTPPVIADAIPGPDWMRLAPEARKATRFIFALDRHGIVTRITPPLAEAVGVETAQIEGQSLADAVRAFDADAAAKIDAALAQQGTWSGILVKWPVSQTLMSVPVELSALPMVDGGLGLSGYSGFGRCRIDAAFERVITPVPAPVETSVQPSLPIFLVDDESEEDVGDIETPLAVSDPLVSAAQPFTSPVSPVSLPAPDASDHGAESDDAEVDEVSALADDAPDLAEDDEALAAGDMLEDDALEHDADDSEPAAASDPNAKLAAPALLKEADVPDEPKAVPESKVVALRAGQKVPTEMAPGLSKGGLSMSERNAFREIAKALGARFDESDDSAPADEPAPLPFRQDNNRADGQEDAPDPDLESGKALSDALRADPYLALANKSGSGFPETRYAILDTVPMAMLILRGDQPLYANRTLLDLAGYADFSQFVAEDGARAIFRKGTVPRDERIGFDTIVLSTREGEMMPVEAHLQRTDWQGTDGKSERATLISMRRAVELEQGKALRSVALDLKRERSEAAELRSILDTATDGVITMDGTGRILSLNGAAEALFGLNQNEVVGESFTQLLANESHASALDYLDGIRANGVKSVLNDGRDVWGRERKGGRIPLFMTLGRINEDDPKRFCAVLRDLTAWKRAEAQLTDARRNAEIASTKKSDFLAKISHEIRTPMNAIIGFAEVMQEERLGPIGSEKYKEYLADIRTSGQHVVSLVNDLLDLAKIEAGRMELNFVAVDLNAMVMSCVGIIQPQATSSRVLVRTQLASQLPHVVADERSIRQIILNMLSNATRFTPAGGQVIISTVLLASGEAVIRIRDTGIGMTGSEIEQALEPFRQVGTQRNKGGTGLGLPLTKALVDANRANFAIRSTPGEGTLIEITFPTTRVLAE